MPEVPRLAASEIIRAFEKAGFLQVRCRRGHCILKKEGHRFLLSIPMHGRKEIGLGLLKAQIVAAGLSVEEFIELVDG